MLWLLAFEKQSANRLNHRYTISTDDWTAVDPLPSACHETSCARTTYNGHDSILCLLSWDVTPSLAVFGLGTETWSTSPATPPLPNRHATKSFVTGRSLVFVGGLDPRSGWDVVPNAIRFDLDTGVWDGLTDEADGLLKGKETYVIREYYYYQRV